MPLRARYTWIRSEEGSVFANAGTAGHGDRFHSSHDFFALKDNRLFPFWQEGHSKYSSKCWRAHCSAKTVAITDVHSTFPVLMPEIILKLKGAPADCCFHCTSLSLHAAMDAICNRNNLTLFLVMFSSAISLLLFDFLPSIFIFWPPQSIPDLIGKGNIDTIEKYLFWPLRFVQGENQK